MVMPPGSVRPPAVEAQPLAHLLARRLLAVAVAVLVLQALYVAWDYNQQEDYLLTNAVQNDMARLIKSATNQIDGGQPPGGMIVPPDLAGRYRNFPQNYGYELRTLDGRILTSANANVLRGVPLEAGALTEEIAREDTIDGTNRHYASQSFETGEATLRLRVAAIGDPARTRLTVLMEEVVDHVSLPAVPLAILMLATAWLVLRRTLRSLEETAAAVERVAPGGENVRLSLTGAPAEVVALGYAVNRLLDQLNASLEAQRGFAANVAHELRTPLSLLTLELGTIDHPAARRAQADAQGMARLITQLLAMAQLEGLVPSSLKPVRLSEVSRDAVARLAPAAVASGRQLEFVEHAPATVMGQREMLEGALRNLLENALRVSPPGATVCVETGPGREIHVYDQGPGIPPGQEEAIFLRFHQADGVNGGTAGLGLAIVRRTMELHGGSARAANIAGTGARFTLDFDHTA
jgi:signal transduction histidine kinase